MEPHYCGHHWAKKCVVIKKVSLFDLYTKVYYWDLRNWRCVFISEVSLREVPVCVRNIQVDYEVEDVTLAEKISLPHLLSESAC